MTQEDKAIYIAAIQKFGNENQILQLQEEMAELTIAINGYRRGRGTIDNIIEEIADVQIMLDQMKIMFSATDEKLEQYKQYKTIRLNQRIHGKSL